MINEFLSELSNLLEKYNYSIVSGSGDTPIVGIMNNLPPFENLYVDDLIDKDSISRYFLTELEWNPIFEPVGTVEFLGKDITVHDSSGWLAMNKNGSVFYFTEEPTIRGMHYSCDGDETYLGVMHGVKNPDAWKTSAMYFNLKENEDKRQ